MNVWVSSHAAERFVERVRPGLSAKAGREELGRLVEQFGEVCDWPEWAFGEMQPGRAAVLIADGIVAVVEPRGGLWRVVTVLTRGAYSDEMGHRGRGSMRRAKRRARRVAGQQYLDRASRPGRAAALAPRMDGEA